MIERRAVGESGRPASGARSAGALFYGLLVIGCAAQSPRDRSPPGPCPDGMALVGRTFCIDRWEASLVEVDGDGERAFSPYETPQGHAVRAVSREGVVPQGYVSRDQAGRACAASGKRLCEEGEWMTACQGDEPHAFPYGDTREKGACNDSGTSPLRVVYRDSPDAYFAGPMNDPRLNQLPNTVAKTGAFLRCSNGLGVFDMVGNLHEWVASQRPTFRGGYYLDTHRNGDGCAYRTTAHASEYHDYSTGFRCCADPKK
jgi:formylglycine-generating enzyme